MRQRPKPLKPKAKLPVARKPPENEGSRVRELEKRLAEALKDKAEALEQQNATNEILRVISSSPTELQPVLDAVAERAARLCDSFDGSIFRVDGDMLRLVAHNGTIPETGRATPPDIPLVRGTVAGRSIIEGRTVQVADLQAETQEFPEGSARARQIGWRTQLSVPLVRGGTAIGVIAMRRIEARPFTDTQIELLKTFADQAVIAIENVRLFTELQTSNRELTAALDTQTATSDILRVISRSQTDVQPVFDAIVQSAVRLLRAHSGMLTRVAGDWLELAAFTSIDRAYDDAIRAYWPRPLHSKGGHTQVIRERAPINIADAGVDPRVPEAGRAVARLSGLRSVASVPLLRNDEAIGTVVVNRQEPGGFTDDEIALLQTFADQAVIAIENVRLFNETKEALEQQTATSEILQAISSSTTDLQPVFDTIARNAAKVCEAFDAVVVLADGEEFVQRAHHGPIAAELGARYPLRGTVGGRAILEARIVHVENLAEASEYPAGRELAQRAGYRTTLSIPLLRDGAAIGAIGIRRTEVLPFSEQQIALLQTFADQAVIAIENVRLFTELQASNHNLKMALDQKTATGEVLQVISRSQTDVQPVFDAIADSAVRLFQADICGVFRVMDGQVHEVSSWSRLDPALQDLLRRSYPRALDTSTRIGQAILECRVLQITDTQDPRTPSVIGLQRLGFRSQVNVPMLRGGEAIGGLSVVRRRPGAFSDDQIDLLKIFADQAVIAIENVRLFTELQQKNEALTQAHAQVTESLDQQTATSQILQVISGSPTDVQPVFDAIARSATRLCEGTRTLLCTFDGELISLAAYHNATPEALESARAELFPLRPRHELPFARAILNRAVVHVPDVDLEPGPTPEFLRQARVRSALCAPLLRDGHAIGVIAVSRPEARPFSDAQIELLRTFADQAVIAIENVGLLKELEARNRDLTESLEQQTATSEILRVISGSPTDLQPVFDAVTVSAARLCEALDSHLYRVEGDRLRIAAHHGPLPVDETLPLVATTGTGRAVLERRTIHVADMQSESDEYPQGSLLARRLGHRTNLLVPLIREGEAIGVIAMRRAESRLFSERQVALLQTFADQAVIAIENVRLFKELEARNRDLTEALEQQTATAEILRVISASPTDIDPVLDTVARTAARLCEAVDAAIHRLDGDRLRIAAHFGPIPLARAVLDEGMLLDAGLVTGRSVLEARSVHVPDLASAEEFPLGRDYARRLGYRTTLAVPLLRQGTALGAIVVRREQVRPFTESQVELLQTFADQAVIAIENVRLFTELQEKNQALTQAHAQVSESLEQQTATSDILRVISRSQTDVQPVFDAIVASAVRLLQGYSGALTRSAGDQIELAALTSTDDAGDAALRALFPQSLQSEVAHAQAMRDRAPLNITDAQTDPRVPEAVRAQARTRGYRSWVGVALLRHDEAIGTISVTRREPGGFTDDEIALLKTFADQAVIAIENVRLFKELEARTHDLTRSVEQLTALGDVGRAVSSSLDLDTVLTTIVGRAVQLSGTDGGTIFEYDEGTEEFVPRATLNADESQSALLRATRLRRGEGAVGQMAVTREALQIPDIAAKGAYESRLRGALLEAGTRAVLAIPLLHEERIVGGLVVTRRTPGEFTAEVVEILKTFATQSALAIQNARLFHEIERKSRELEVASQHKSEFLANMSHELRTPLNAIIGFSEVLTDRMFGELNEKQEEYLKDIYASGTHLLSLINDILDLSKIEAGRTELELTDFHLPTALDNALTLVRERATRRGIALHTNLDNRLSEVRADERKIRQVVLNLLSNAIKFTPEGGRIEVAAVPKDEFVEVSVIDTGIGIAPEDQEKVFEEFRQVGAAEKKAEGTGLGLTLCRKFIELHGGKIWVKSELGAGSTFTFTLPVRRG